MFQFQFQPLNATPLMNPFIPFIPDRPPLDPRACTVHSSHCRCHHFVHSPHLPGFYSRYVRSSHRPPPGYRQQRTAASRLEWKREEGRCRSLGSRWTRPRQDQIPQRRLAVGPWRGWESLDLSRIQSPLSMLVWASPTSRLRIMHPYPLI